MKVVKNPGSEWLCVVPAVDAGWVLVVCCGGFQRTKDDIAQLGITWGPRMEKNGKLRNISNFGHWPLPTSRQTCQPISCQNWY